MFSIQPFDAEYEEYDAEASRSWKPCRVIGITPTADGKPAYIIETNAHGISSLTTASYLRKRA